MKPTVTAIILNYNDWESTQTCISSLELMHYENLSIVLVDNNSSSYPPEIQFQKKDYTLYDHQHIQNSYDSKNTAVLSKFKNKKPSIFSIKNYHNSGFSSGVNLGVFFAKKVYNSDYYWLLNNDTKCNPTTLKALVKKANARCIVSSKLVSKTNQPLQSAGTIHPRFATSKPSHSKIDYLPFTSVLIHKEIFELNGPLNENYFMYYEDVDYCKRAKQHGIQLKLSHDSTVIHDESKTFNKNSKIKSDQIYITSKKLFMYNHGYTKKWILFSLLLSATKRLCSGHYQSAIKIIKIAKTSPKNLIGICFD